MEFRQYGVWYAADKLNIEQWRDFIVDVETLGYDALWYSEARGFESMALASFLLCNTEKLKIGSSIANIYARDAFASRCGLQTLSAISDHRFILGLGVSHVPMVEGVRGHAYGKPVSTMRRYLSDMYDEHADGSNWPVMLGALGPKMLALSAQMTRGALPYNVTPQHTARARAILGDDNWLVVEQKVCLQSDATTARALARQELERYMGLTNYRNNWLSLGFTEQDLEHGGSDRFIDAMVVWGDEKTIHARLTEHLDAGADQVCLQPVHDVGDIAAAKKTLRALATT